MRNSTTVSIQRQKRILLNPKNKGLVRRGQVKQESFLMQRFRSMGIDLNQARMRARGKIPEMKYPRGIEKRYQVEALRLVRQWNNLYKQMVDPHLESLAQNAYVMRSPESVGIKTDEFLNGAHHDTWADDLALLMEGFKIQVNETIGPWENIVENVGSEISSWNLVQWQNTVSAVMGTNIFIREPWLGDQLNSFTKQNVSLVKKLSEETTNGIEEIIEDGLQRGRRIEDIRKSIQNGTKLSAGRFKKTRNRAKLIARDQVGKLNGQLTQIRHNDFGITQYRLRTAQDERVRTSHANMEGKLCQWKNAFVYKDLPSDPRWKQRSSIGGVNKHPGQDYQCRCTSQADFSTILEE